jgi:hypothetical protein
MATGYSRQSAGEIVTGSPILAASFNNEYNAILAFANAATGHNHDGTAGGGSPLVPTSLSGLSSNGIVARISASAFAPRTITGTADKITITNGDGVSGNPTITIAAGYLGQTSITTLGTITTGTWSGLFGAVSGANLTSLTAANISAGTAGIDISGNAATATLATTATSATSASTATLAASATALATPRNIGGVSFNGTADIVPQTIQVAATPPDSVTYPLLTNVITGANQPVTHSSLSYNTTNGTLAALIFSGSGSGLTGTAASLTAGTASAVAVGGITGLGSGVATWLATPSSANLRSALTDESGSGALLFANGALGTPASGVGTNLTGLPIAGLVSGTLASGVGAIATSGSLGTVSSGTVTPLATTNGNFNHYTNNGAHTLAPPSGVCTMIVEITNAASAGAITTSSYTLVEGDAFTTTNGDRFVCYITKTTNASILSVRKVV